MDNRFGQIRKMAGKFTGKFARAQPSEKEKLSSMKTGIEALSFYLNSIRMVY
jgi:hypothetical protein